MTNKCQDSKICSSTFALLQFCNSGLTCYEAEEWGNHDPHAVEAEPHLLLGRSTLASHLNQITMSPTCKSWVHFLRLHTITVVHVWKLLSDSFYILSSWVLVPPQNFLQPAHKITSTLGNLSNHQCHCETSCETLLTIKKHFPITKLSPIGLGENTSMGNSSR